MTMQRFNDVSRIFLAIFLFLMFVITAPAKAESNQKLEDQHVKHAIKPAVIILLGAPGSGKGTQALKMADELKFPHISSGDLLRENVKQNTNLGKKAKAYMDAGKLVPDDLVTEMVFKRIAEPDSSKGYILDGFPRTVLQAKELDHHLKNKAILIVINLQVPDEKITARIIKRAGEKTEKRSDDTPAVIKKRLEVYHEQTEPVISYYKHKGQLITVDGEHSPEVVFKEIMSAYTNKTDGSSSAKKEKP